MTTRTKIQMIVDFLRFPLNSFQKFLKIWPFSPTWNFITMACILVSDAPAVMIGRQKSRVMRFSITRSEISESPRISGPSISNIFIISSFSGCQSLDLPGLQGLSDREKIRIDTDAKPPDLFDRLFTCIRHHDRRAAGSRRAKYAVPAVLDHIAFLR